MQQKTNRLRSRSLSFVCVSQLLSLWKVFHAWHAYDHSLKSNNDPNCPPIYEVTRPYSKDTIYTLKLWPGLMTEYDKKQGDTVYGSELGLRKVFEYQHPPAGTCADAKYIISEGNAWGFGSRMHLEGLVIGLAMHLGRIAMPHPDGDGISWETKVILSLFLSIFLFLTLSLSLSLFI
jgi:hypothetical protein